MREIKFRAWDGEKFVTDGNLAICMDGQIVGWRANESNSWVLQQYTGLKDKNGKEIYEGDVVVYTRHDKTIEAVVEWDNGCYYLRNHKDPVDSDTMNKDSMFFIGAERMEVIGNIYENPELLK